MGYRQPLYPIDSFSQRNQGYPRLAKQEPSSHVPGLSIQPNSGYPSQPNVGPHDRIPSPVGFERESPLGLTLTPLLIQPGMHLIF